MDFKGSTNISSCQLNFSLGNTTNEISEKSFQINQDFETLKNGYLVSSISPEGFLKNFHISVFPVSKPMKVTLDNGSKTFGKG